MCPHATLCVSSHHCMCPHTPIYVLMLLYVSSFYYIRIYNYICPRPHTPICVFIRLSLWSSYYYIYVSSYYNIHVSSYYYICVSGGGGFSRRAQVWTASASLSRFAVRAPLVQWYADKCIQVRGIYVGDLWEHSDTYIVDKYLKYTYGRHMTICTSTRHICRRSMGARRYMCGRPDRHLRYIYGRHMTNIY